MDWTEDRVEQLKRLWAQGLSASQVSRQLGGVSRNAVIGKVHRMGLTGRDRPTQPRALSGHAVGRAKARTTVSRLPADRRAHPVAVPRSRLRVDLPPTTSLMGLTHDACRWPSGDPQEDDFGFCGRHRSGQGAYCDDHARVALRRPGDHSSLPHPPHERRRITIAAAGRAERR